MENNIIEIKSLIKEFGDFKAVNGISFTIKRGEIFSLLGPNGSGKTTTINMILGIITPTSGNILVNGLNSVDNHAHIKNMIGFLTQETVVEYDLTARENIELAAQLYHVDKKIRAQRVEEALEEAELTEFATRKAGKFSGGMQRRLALVKSMVHRPKILILDEPTTGLDVHNRLQMWEKIKMLNKEGITIIMTTQYLEEADALSDRIAILDHGKIRAMGTPSELKKLVSVGNIIEIITEKDDADQTVKILKAKFDLDPELKNDKIIASMPANGGSKLLLGIAAELEKRKINIVSISMHLPTLDDVFVKLTGSDLKDSAEGHMQSRFTDAMIKGRK